MNKLHGTIVGGAVGLIIGIIGLLFLRVEYGSTPAAHTPLMMIITIVLLVIGAAIGYLMPGKTTKPPAIAQPPKIMSKTRIIAVIALGIIVNNSINRYNVGSLSDLVPNADGSVDIYIQNAPPSGNESNWLPAPPAPSSCGFAPPCPARQS